MAIDVAPRLKKIADKDGIEADFFGYAAKFQKSEGPNCSADAL
jgi:hypothetical protein